MLETPSSVHHKSSPTGPVKDKFKRNTPVESQMKLNAVNLSTNTPHHSNKDTCDTMAWKEEVQKAASTANAVKNAPVAPSIGIETPLQHHLPHHGQRPSLAGFDPFSINEYTLSSPSSSRRPPSSPHVRAEGLKDSRKLFDTAAFVSIAGKTTTVEHRSQDSRNSSPANIENDLRQPPSPAKYRRAIDSSSPEKTAATKVTPVQKKKEKTVSLSPRNERVDTSPIFSSGGKLLKFVRKGHRRTKSLEGNVGKDMKLAAVATQDSIPISTVSEPSLADSSTNNKAGSGIVNDLMDLKDKFIQLQIPTLAKPSPTSFLTGKGDEAVRTSYYEPSPFQMEIPLLPELVEVARLNDFVENYRRMDQNFDMNEFIGQSRLDLQNIKIKEHIPISQSLMECGDGITVQGYLSKGTNADSRLEAVVFEGQRYFIVVFRGTTDQQTKVLGASKNKRRAVPFDAEQENVEVYSGFKDEYSKLEQDCFALIDKLTEQNPFCDVVFSGFSFGAAIATLAASRYAMARPTMRVGCFTLASPKVGFSLFRHVVNSQPNLKVIRLELGQDAKCQGPTVGGWQVGHTLVLSGSFGHQSTTQKIHKAVLAYKFDTPKHKKFKTSHPDLRNYVTTLEEIARLNIPWVKDFANTAGKGVVVNNEARQVV